MRTLVSYPGAAVFAQQVALAFLESRALDVFVTTFVFNRESALARALAWAPEPLGSTVLRELERRSVSLLPAAFLRTHPFWEVARAAASRSGVNPVLVDRIWDQQSRTFDALVAKRYVPRTQAVYAYEYTARASFDKARAKGLATILDLPSLSSRAFQVLQRAEKERFPELRSKNDAYFDRKFGERQARRDAEISTADVIVTNSTLTMRSHVAAGADPSRVVVVPLAAPRTIPAISRANDPVRMLKVLWAGSFSLGKGAHYFLEAWRLLAPGRNARADIYGGLRLPNSALDAIPDGLAFHSSVSQNELFAAFESADVLVFPTLSDGFGMVVMEAFARGLPVIVTDQAGAADFVRQGVNGLLIPARDSNALREALQWCLDNRAALHEMRLAALETARRWQWPDYRRALILGIDAGLRRAGYAPKFDVLGQGVNAA